MVVAVRDGGKLVDGILRFGAIDNYTESFGFQWNRFAETQIDRDRRAARASEARLFAETGWDPDGLDGADILEVGSGAGRFSRPILQRTKANLYSVDYSSAVLANRKNNGAIAPDRFHLFQASIYDMPFADGSFDHVLCLGVLQHTPDFRGSIAALVAKAKAGGEIVVDFYPVRGWWTKVHAKYLLRPVTKRMDHEKLLRLIDRHADRLIRLHHALSERGLHVLTRFLPLVDIRSTFPKDLSEAEVREWAVLDTFDMYSPQHDHPQRIQAVARMFEEAGAKVTFAGEIATASGLASVVRAIKK